jgi:hypothetical protein
MKNYKELCPHCSIGCESAVKLLQDDSLPWIRCEEMTNVYFFRKLPKEYRLANRYDLFINEDLKVGVHCLMKSFHSERYENYKVKGDTDKGWLMEFVRAGNVYVK